MLLTNSAVSEFGSNVKNTPRVRLQEYSTTKALLSSLRVLRYFTGTAKSTPITLKGVLTSVLSLERELVVN